MTTGAGSLALTILKLFLIGIVVIVLAKIALTVGGILLGILGVVFAIAMVFAIGAGVIGTVFLVLFGPFLLVGWLMLAGFRWLFGSREPGGARY